MTILYQVLLDAFQDKDAVRAGDAEARTAGAEAREETRVIVEKMNTEVQLSVAKASGSLVDLTRPEQIIK